MTRTLTIIGLAAALAAVPAFAATYKWIDERGVVHYSDKPPREAKRLVPIEDRLSVYEADRRARAVAQAPAAANQNASQNIAQRIENLERQLRAERRARELAQSERSQGERAQTAYEQCLSDRRPDCGPAALPAPYAAPGPWPPAPVVFAPVHRRVAMQPFAPLPAAVPVGVSVPGMTGVTAGNLVTFGQPASGRTRTLHQ